MKLPRFLSTRLASSLALGCALLAFAAVPGAQAQVKVVPLSTDQIDKVAKFVQSVNSDPTKKAAMEASDKDEAVMNAMMSGGSINSVISTKFPQAAAIYKAGGFNPDDFLAIVVSLSMAASNTTEGTSDPAVAKANVDFYNANKAKVDKIMSDMTTQ